MVQKPLKKYSLYVNNCWYIWFNKGKEKLRKTLLQKGQQLLRHFSKMQTLQIQIIFTGIIIVCIIQYKTLTNITYKSKTIKPLGKLKKHSTVMDNNNTNYYDIELNWKRDAEKNQKPWTQQQNLPLWIHSLVNIAVEQNKIKNMNTNAKKETSKKNKTEKNQQKH